MIASDPNADPFATAWEADDELDRISDRLNKVNLKMMNEAQAFKQAHQSLGDTPAQILLAWYRKEQRLNAEILPDFIGKARKQYDILEAETKKLEQISLDGLEFQAKKDHHKQLSRLNTDLSGAFRRLVNLTMIVSVSTAFKNSDASKEMESVGQTLLGVFPVVEIAFRKLCNME